MSYRSPMRGMSLAQKIGYQWKRGWNEIPEVMGGAVMFMFGFGMWGFVMYQWYNTENMTKRFKHRLIVMRPDDPRVAQLRRFDNSPPITSV